MLHASIDLPRTRLWVTVWFFSCNFQTQGRDLPSFPLNFNFKLKYLAYSVGPDICFICLLFIVFIQICHIFFSKGREAEET